MKQLTQKFKSIKTLRLGNTTLAKKIYDYKRITFHSTNKLKLNVFEKPAQCSNNKVKSYVLVMKHSLGYSCIAK